MNPAHVYGNTWQHPADALTAFLRWAADGKRLSLAEAARIAEPAWVLSREDGDERARWFRLVRGEDQCRIEIPTDICDRLGADVDRLVEYLADGGVEINGRTMAQTGADQRAAVEDRIAAQTREPGPLPRGWGHSD